MKTEESLPQVCEDFLEIFKPIRESSEKVRFNS